MTEASVSNGIQATFVPARMPRPSIYEIISTSTGAGAIPEGISKSKPADKSPNGLLIMQESRNPGFLDQVSFYQF